MSSEIDDLDHFHRQQERMKRYRKDFPFVVSYPHTKRCEAEKWLFENFGTQPCDKWRYDIDNVNKFLLYGQSLFSIRFNRQEDAALFKLFTA